MMTCQLSSIFSLAISSVLFSSASLNFSCSVNRLALMLYVKQVGGERNILIIMMRCDKCAHVLTLVVQDYEHLQSVFLKALNFHQ